MIEEEHDNELDAHEFEQRTFALQLFRHGVVVDNQAIQSDSAKNQVISDERRSKDTEDSRDTDEIDDCYVEVCELRMEEAFARTKNVVSLADDGNDRQN